MAIDTSFQNTYQDVLRHAVQQSENRLRGAVDEAKIEGEYVYLDELQAFDMVEITTRNADTPNVDPDFARRRTYARRFAAAPLLDRFDKLAWVRDPQSNIYQATVKAANKKAEKIIIDAFEADVESGKDGGSTTTFDSGNTITCGSNLTVAKCAETAAAMDANDLLDEMDRYMVISPSQHQKLMAETSYTSSDYNVSKPLANWELPPIAGFKFIISNQLTKSGAVRACYAWVKPSMQFAIGKDIFTDISVRSDKMNGTQILTEMWIGALRVNEPGVFKVNCTEA